MRRAKRWSGWRAIRPFEPASVSTSSPRNLVERSSWRASGVASKGGAEQLSPQERVLIELIVATRRPARSPQGRRADPTMRYASLSVQRFTRSVTPSGRAGWDQIRKASSIRRSGAAASRDFALPTRRSCRPIPRGHTNPPALMIGKKGANLVRGDE